MKAYKCDICGKLFEFKTSQEISDKKQIQIIEQAKNYIAGLCYNCLLGIREFTNKKRSKANEQH